MTPTVLDIVQFIVMSTVAVLLWTSRHAFRGGQWSTNVENRLDDVESRCAGIEQAQASARQRSSEVEGRVTAKIGALELDYRELRTEMTIRSQEAKRDHERYERDIELLMRIARHTRPTS